MEATRIMYSHCSKLRVRDLLVVCTEKNAAARERERASFRRDHTSLPAVQ